MSIFPSYGQTVPAEAFWKAFSALSSPHILHGMSITVDSNVISVNPGTLISAGGVFIRRVLKGTLTFTPGESRAGYTIHWTHTPQRLINGSTEILEMTSGIFTQNEFNDADSNGFYDTDPTRTIVGWIRYPGASVALVTDHIIEVPKFRDTLTSTLTTLRGNTGPVSSYDNSDGTNIVRATVLADIKNTGVSGTMASFVVTDYSVPANSQQASQIVKVYKTFRLPEGPIVPIRTLEILFVSGPSNQFNAQITAATVWEADIDGKQRILAQPTIPGVDGYLSAPMSGITRARISFTKNPQSALVTAEIDVTVTKGDKFYLYDMRLTDNVMVETHKLSTVYRIS